MFERLVKPLLVFLFTFIALVLVLLLTFYFAIRKPAQDVVSSKINSPAKNLLVADDIKDYTNVRAIYLNYVLGRIYYWNKEGYAWQFINEDTRIVCLEASDKDEWVDLATFLAPGNEREVEKKFPQLLQGKSNLLPQQGTQVIMSIKRIGGSLDFVWVLGCDK